MRRPKARIPGRELAGRVEAVGADVVDLQVGDDVFGWGEGTFAEHACVAAENLVRTPVALSAVQAAALPISGFTALQALRDKGQVRPGQRVLVIGASGGVGTLAVQLAWALGADVTGVCSAANAELVRSLGARRVIDYETEDFAAGDVKYDVIVDLVGDRSISACRRALVRGGTLVMVAGTGGRWFKGTQRFLAGVIASPLVGHRLRPLIHRDDRDDLARLAALAEAGSLRPVVSARYKLEDVVDALRHFEAGHATGKVSLIP
jgi:NADPH:quinone reductase-like Zn-dependent oxidoreductase